MKPDYTFECASEQDLTNVLAEHTLLENQHCVVVREKETEEGNIPAKVYLLPNGDNVSKLVRACEAALVRYERDKKVFLEALEKYGPAELNNQGTLIESGAVALVAEKILELSVRRTLVKAIDWSDVLDVVKGVVVNEALYQAELWHQSTSVVNNLFRQRESSAWAKFARIVA